MKDYQSVLLKILEITEKIQANLQLVDLFNEICRAITAELGWQNTIIVLRDESTKTSRPMAVAGMSPEMEKKILASPPSPWTQWYKIPEFKVSQSFFIRDLSKHLDIVPDSVRGRIMFGDSVNRDPAIWQGDDILIIPIRAKDEWIGMINVDNPLDNQAPDLQHIQILELFANQVAIAIQNAKAFEKQIDFNKRLAIEVEKKTKQLEEQNVELETYISSLTHDLKTPLVSMNINMDGLVNELGEVNSEDVDYYLGRMRYNVSRLGTLLDDLVTYYNMQKMPVSEESVDTRQIIIEEYKRVHNQFPEKEVDFILSGDFPKIYRPKYALSLIFGNLISNALKFSKSDSGIEVVAGANKTDEGYVFSLKDNGIGIDMAYSDKIFMLFERLEDKKVSGTGVGLATVSKMVKKVNGRVWLESEPGDGSIFYVLIPFLK